MGLWIFLVVSYTFLSCIMYFEPGIWGYINLEIPFFFPPLFPYFSLRSPCLADMVHKVRIWLGILG